MVVADNAPSTCDLENERVDSAANPSCSIEDNPPNDITDPVDDDDFTMGEELDYDGHEQQLDTMQEDQAEVEHEEADIIQLSLSNKCPLSSPSLPPTHSCSSHGTFKNHADRAMGRGSIRSPKPPSSIASSSMRTMARTRSTSSGISLLTSSSRQLSTTLKDSGAKNLTSGRTLGRRSTVSAAASEYMIAKVNALHQEHDLNFQQAKTLDLQVLEAQAKVHTERKAALQLEIELLKLKGGVE
ncbi:hypothetical protein P692DRAFT_20879119 [Suillus brevipes Sb2]|nr:hypothetical protein P692DRAFT_20879119 [Suillus brevipes Sb2]